MADSCEGHEDSSGTCLWDHTSAEGGYSRLPGDKGGSHEYAAVAAVPCERQAWLPENISELGSTINVCRQTSKRTSERLEPSSDKITAASLASHEHLPTNAFLVHVRYEIGEHPLADIVSLTGGGSSGSRVFVRTLVPHGKAVQAGVRTGDELVAVSGRRDFQRLSAQRLLESLPTPTLLVFAKDAARVKSQLQRDEAENSARTHGSLDDFASALISPLSRSRTSLEGPDRENNEWLYDLGGASGSLAAESGNGGTSRGAGAVQSQHGVGGPRDLGRHQSALSNWADGIRLPEGSGAAEGHRPQGRQQWAGEGARPPQEGGDPWQNKQGKKVAMQLAIIKKDDTQAGLPSCHSFLGPNVQVELCDQVVFNPTASLWMQGNPRRAPELPRKMPRDGQWEGSTWSKDAPETAGLPQFIYELPRRDARRLVETARRAASRAGRRERQPEFLSVEPSGTSVGSEDNICTISDLDTLMACSDLDNVMQGFPDRFPLPRELSPGPAAFAAMSSTKPLQRPTFLSDAVSSNGPRLVPEPGRVGTGDNDEIAPEDDRDQPSEELS